MYTDAVSAACHYPVIFALVRWSQYLFSFVIAFRLTQSLGGVLGRRYLARSSTTASQSIMPTLASTCCVRGAHVQVPHPTRRGFGSLGTQPSPLGISVRRRKLAAVLGRNSGWTVWHHNRLLSSSNLSLQQAKAAVNHPEA